MLLLIKMTVCFAVVILLIWLSHPPDLRRFRWLKIILSLPFVYLIANAMTRSLDNDLNFAAGAACAFSFLPLGILWSSNISWRMSGSVVGFFYGDANSQAGYRPDYHFARSHLRDGNLEEALKLAQIELKKDPTNYEGLMLIAGIYQEKRLPEKSISGLEIILNNPDATDAQKEIARAEIKKCEQLQIALKIDAPIPRSSV